MRTLSPAEARELYDRVGSSQDRHRLYEDPATERLLELGAFSSASSVFELGCGTGRFAHRLLADHLPPSAHYHGTDVSPRMVELAHRRLEAFAPRARVTLTDGSPPTDEPAASHDRFVSNFVFDLLSESAIRSALREAHRMLAPGGLLCLAGLSTGSGPTSRLVATVIRRLHAWRPKLVGGCRPLELEPLLSLDDWDVVGSDRIVAYAIPSEVVVAARRPRRVSTGPSPESGISR